MDEFGYVAPFNELTSIAAYVIGGAAIAAVIVLLGRYSRR